MEEVAATPKPKRKRTARRRGHLRVVKPETEKPEFVGLTAESCCADCHQENCVITGKPLCGHPRKGGLQPPDMMIPETLARYQRAAKALAHAEIEK